MMLSAGEKYLVIHLDDVGMCLAANSAWEIVHKAGVVSSASIMMPCPWAPEALERAKRLDSPDLGVHLTLTCEWETYRWGPYGPGKRGLLCDNRGYLPRNEAEHERITASDEGRAAVKAELEAQIQGALAAGVEITHLDSHMFAAIYPPNLEIYMDLALKYSLPAMLPGSIPAWRPWCRDEEEAAALSLAVSPARDAGMPLFDRIVGVPLSNPPEDRQAAAEQLIRDCVPGLNFLFLHAAEESPELRTIAGDWKSRVGDLDVFSDPGLLKVIREEGIQLIGMRELGEAFRT